MFKDYDELLSIINDAENHIGAQFDYGDPVVDNNGTLHIKIKPNLFRSDNSYEDYDFDYDEDFCNGEHMIRKALEHHLKNHNINIIVHLHEPPAKELYFHYLLNKKKEEIQKQKYQLTNSTSYVSIFNSQGAKEKFYQLAAEQRGIPEQTMLETQKFIGGGELAYLIEHVGDLTHRISQKTYIENGNIENAIDDILPKIQSSLRILSNKKNMTESVDENLLSNYQFNSETSSVFKKMYPDFNNFKSEAIDRLNKYADSHQALKVYNYIQKYCRNAAINIGRGDYKEAEQNLRKVLDSIQDNTFVKKASIVLKEHKFTIDNPEEEINKKKKKKRKATV